MATRSKQAATPDESDEAQPVQADAQAVTPEGSFDDSFSPAFATRSIDFVPADDDVRGTIQYVTKVGADFFSELLPLPVKVGEKFLCAADQNIYEVTNATTAAMKNNGRLLPRLVNSWDGLDPVSDADAADGNYPDASYFFNGPIDVDGTPSYVNVQDGKVVVFAASSTHPRPDGYPAIANPGNVVSAVVGGTPASIDKLFAAQAEVDVSPAAHDTFDTARKTALLKFYNILDGAGKLTALGVSIENRIKYNEAVFVQDALAGKVTKTHHLPSPSPGGTDVTYVVADGTKVYWDAAAQAWVGASPSWKTDPKGQYVDLPSGTNQSVGYLPGRAK